MKTLELAFRFCFLGGFFLRRLVPLFSTLLKKVKGLLPQLFVAQYFLRILCIQNY